MPTRPTTILRVALVGIAVAAPARAAVTCPALHEHRRLTAFSIFEGDPAEVADLAPDSSRGGPGGSYVNVWLLEANAKLVAICRYEETEVRIDLPSGLKRCRSSGKPRALQAGCE